MAALRGYSEAGTGQSCEHLLNVYIGQLNILHLAAGNSIISSAT